MSTRRRKMGQLALMFTLMTGVACSDSDKKEPADLAGDRDGSAGQSDASQTGDGGDGSDKDGGAGTADDAGGGTGGGNGDGAVGSGGPELCDGVDNDGNGITDDVDAEGDGVCDCLNIATIGEIGPWSNGGNVFKTWLDSRSPIGADELGDAVLTDELLGKYQVIVVLYAGTMQFDGNGRTLLAHHTFTDDEVAAFGRWVKQGGGVMTTVGYTGDEASEVANVNRLLNPLGAGYSTSKLDTQGFITSWLDHPLSDQVTRIRTDNGVEPDGTSATTLAYDANNHVALQVSEPEKGHVVVWGDEWITYDSEWADSADQQVSRFWLNALKYMSPAKVCQVRIPELL